MKFAKFLKSPILKNSCQTIASVNLVTFYLKWAALVLFKTDFRIRATHNYRAGWNMTFTLQWMSVTKAGVSQISSEIFNGIGSADQDQDRRKLVRGGGMHLVPGFHGCYALCSIIFHQQQAINLIFMKQCTAVDTKSRTI